MIYSTYDTNNLYLIGGATLIFDTELVAVNGKGSGAEDTDNSEL